MTTPPPRLCRPFLLVTLCLLPGIAGSDTGLGRSLAVGVAMQGDGRIVAVGEAQWPSFSPQFAVARYQSDGSLDTSFGGDGIVRTSIHPVPESWSFARDVDLGGDGRVVVAGGSRTSAGDDDDVAVARYLVSGSLDPSLDGDGVLWIDLGGGEVASDVAVLPDDRIMLAGIHGTDLLLIRLAADGSADPTFSSANPVILPLGLKPGSTPRLAIQSDGKIVVTCLRDAPPDNVVLLRFHTDGQPDLTFSDDGMLTLSGVPTPNTEFGYWVVPLVLQSGDRAVIANPDGALVRYSSSGTVDATFHGDGSPAPTGLPYVFDLAVAQDDTLVVLGATLADGFGVARLDENGTPDSGFGTGGVSHPELTTSEAEWQLFSLALQDDGKTIAAGAGDHGENDIQSFGLARLADDGSLDPAFDGDGRLVESDCRRFALTSPSCIDATRAWIKIRRRETVEGTTDAGSRLRWKWEGTSSAPVDTPDELYTLCVYDTHGGEPELADWLCSTEVKLKPLTNGRQRLSSKAGYRSPDGFDPQPEVPDTFSAELYFEQNATTIVQLVRSDGSCFVSSFAQADTSRNGEGRFQARIK